MTTKMIDAITVDRDNIFKGACRLIYSDPGTLTSFPGRFESVMNPDTYALQSGWSDFGATTEDGVTITREAELSEGIALDQRNTPISKGEPEDWNMGLETVLLDQSLDNIALVWQAGTNRAHAAGGGTAAQHILDLDAPSAFTERMVAAIQEDPETGKLRMACFRKVKPKADNSELKMSRTAASELPAAFTLNADEDVSEGSGQFGRIYSMD